jgi:hypothetical protein
VVTGLADGATPGVVTAAPVVVLGNGAGEVKGLPTPGLPLGLPLPAGALTLPSVPTPEAVPPAPDDGLPPVAPPPAAVPPLLPPPAPAPPPARASAHVAANGPATSARASSNDNVMVILLIANLLRTRLDPSSTPSTSSEQRVCHRRVVRGCERRGIMSRF